MFVLSYGATCNDEQVTCAMNLGSVQSSPAVGSAVISSAYAEHIMYQTRHSLPSSASSLRTPTHRHHNRGNYNMDTIRSVREDQVQYEIMTRDVISLTCPVEDRTIPQVATPVHHHTVAATEDTRHGILLH